MAGTIDGGKKAAKTNEAREPGFYKRIGEIGGRKGRTGGFFKNRELARIAGAKGGRISRRTKAPAPVDGVDQTMASGRRAVDKGHSASAGGSFGFSGQ